MTLISMIKKGLESASNFNDFVKRIAEENKALQNENAILRNQVDTLELDLEMSAVELEKSKGSEEYYRQMVDKFRGLRK
jgi:regulator of replication initiation timing